MFGKYGYIHNVHILYDRYVATKAFKAFINFALEEEATKALNAKGSFRLRSRVLDVQKSKRKKK